MSEFEVMFKNFEDCDYREYTDVQTDFPKILKAFDNESKFGVEIVVDGIYKEINVFADNLHTIFDARSRSIETLTKIGQLIVNGDIKEAWRSIKRSKYVGGDDPMDIEMFLGM